MSSNYKIFTGQANIPLCQRICDILGKKIANANHIKFADGELSICIEESVRGQEIFLIQSLSSPVNDNVMELLIMIDALKRASAEKITVIIPYFAYARQDRSVVGRQPISAKLLCNLISTAGADQVITIEPHTAQMMAFFDVPVDGLSAVDVFVNYYNQEERGDDYIIVSPDVGGVERVRGYASHIENMPIAVINKRRDNPGSVAEMFLVGDVSGKHAIIIDDMVDTGGTLCKASDLLLQNGALDVRAFIVHGLLSKNAKNLIQASSLKELVITDTIMHENLPEKIKVMSITTLLSEVIARLHHQKSLSDLY